MLTGKYQEGIPDDSRAMAKGYEWLQEQMTNAQRREAVTNLLPIAQELGCSLAQMALAWCLKNPHVSTVITGASRVSQVHENMKALEVVTQLDDAVMQRIETALAPVKG